MVQTKINHPCGKGNHTTYINGADLGMVHMALFYQHYTPVYPHDINLFCCLNPRLVGGIPTPLKNMSSSVGMMTFPINVEKLKMFQTTSQKILMWRNAQKHHDQAHLSCLLIKLLIGLVGRSTGKSTGNQGLHDNPKWYLWKSMEVYPQYRTICTIPMIFG